MKIEQYPTWLEGHIKASLEEKSMVTLCSSTGNEWLEVWYYGELFTITGEVQPYIVDSDEAPALVVAHDRDTGENFVIFDGGRHGYNNMFCDEHDLVTLENRSLKPYEMPVSKLLLTLGYSIDYEDEKDSFDIDERDMVTLVNGDSIPWKQVKRDGIDYIALFCVDEKGKAIQILDVELA